jgi:ATP-dependent Clp protease adapter protein ClpS
MPRYHFGCCNGDPIVDEDGVILPDDQTARSYAMQIIHELQRADEGAWGSLTMEVTRDGRAVWRIPFEVSDPPR